MTRADHIALAEAPFGSELYCRALKLREALLRKPLGLTMSEEELADDAHRRHFCAMIDGAVIGYRCAIGRNCYIGPRAVITHALIGNNVIIHAGVAIGQDGFGFAMGGQGHLKVRQIGRVMAFALAYVAISSACMAVGYGAAIGPLTRGELPLELRLELLNQQGGITGLHEMLLIWATMMTSLSVLFALAVGLYFSHKLAGPLYRFKLELRRVADGETIRPVKLRRGDDDFEDVADALNRALERVQGDALRARGEAERAEARLAELCRGVERHTSEPERVDAGTQLGLVEL